MSGRAGSSAFAAAGSALERFADGGVAAGEAFPDHDGLEGGGDVIAHPAVFDLLPGGGQRRETGGVADRRDGGDESERQARRRRSNVSRRSNTASRL